jgi:hypothetical protein
MNQNLILKEAPVVNRIYSIHGKKVMRNGDSANLHGVKTKRLHEATKRTSHFDNKFNQYIQNIFQVLDRSSKKNLNAGN